MKMRARMLLVLVMLSAIFIVAMQAWDYECSGICTGCRCDAVYGGTFVIDECCGFCWNQYLPPSGQWMDCCMYYGLKSCWVIVP